MGQVNSVGANDAALARAPFDHAHGVLTGAERAAALERAPKPRDPKLWKAANDFQEVMLSQFTQSMRTTEHDSELFEECPGRETFDQMLSGAIAHEMSKSGAMGLNKMIYRAMGGAYEKAHPAAATPPSFPPPGTERNQAPVHTETTE